MFDDLNRRDFLIKMAILAQKGSRAWLQNRLSDVVDPASLFESMPLADTAELDAAVYTWLSRHGRYQRGSDLVGIYKAARHQSEYDYELDKLCPIAFEKDEMLEAEKTFRQLKPSAIQIEESIQRLQGIEPERMNEIAGHYSFDCRHFNPTTSGYILPQEQTAAADLFEHATQEIPNIGNMSEELWLAKESNLTATRSLWQEDYDAWIDNLSNTYLGDKFRKAAKNNVLDKPLSFSDMAARRKSVWGINALTKKDFYGEFLQDEKSSCENYEVNETWAVRLQDTTNTKDRFKS